MTISVTGFSGTKNVLVQTNKKTVVRRYAVELDQVRRCQAEQAG